MKCHYCVNDSSIIFASTPMCDECSLLLFGTQKEEVMTDHICQHCELAFRSVKLQKYCSVKCRSAAIYRRAVADGRRSTNKNREPAKVVTGKFPTLEERNRRVKFCG